MVAILMPTSSDDNAPVDEYRAIADELTREAEELGLYDDNRQMPTSEMSTNERATGMCPHCGRDVAVRDGLTGYHDWPLPTRQVCPGSKQIPRCAESDGRPLWNGEANPHYYRNQEVARD